MKQYISKGDFIDVYHRINQKGILFFLKMIGFSYSDRVTSKWNHYVSATDFWIIPEIQQRWNKMITGNAQMEYEHYVAQKYFAQSSGLKFLSVGCGDGSHERKFAHYDCFASVEAIDISEKRIEKAKLLAEKEGLRIKYHSGDFTKNNFERESFDVILFNSSLHHFENLDQFLAKHVKSLLKPNGYLIIFEYAGPNRLQWTDKQLQEANRLLKEMPGKYKMLYDGKTVKKKVYRPGILRMLLVDPSEAPDSANLQAALHNNFVTVEETPLGWNITHQLLKGIAHNFLNKEDETQALLRNLFEKEDAFVSATHTTDAIFGVYRK